MNRLSIDELLGKKTIIIGPLQSGKTRLLAKIIKLFMEHGFKNEMVILDFAPQGIEGIGGRITNYIQLNNVLYLAPEYVRAPRYEGKTKEDVIKLAVENERLLEDYIVKASKSGKNILAINDVTLYLHAGNVQNIINLIKSMDTVFITAYYGDEFDDKGSGINEREKFAVNKLIEYMDNVISLG